MPKTNCSSIQWNRHPSAGSVLLLICKLFGGVFSFPFCLHIGYSVTLVSCKASSLPSTHSCLLECCLCEWPALLDGLPALVPKPWFLHGFYLMHKYCFILVTPLGGNIGCCLDAFSFCTDFFQLPFLPAHSWCSCLDTSIASWLLLFSRSVMSNSLWPRGLQHSRSPCVSPSPGVHPSSWLLNWWCYPTLSSAALFFCLQSFPASGSFSMLPIMVQCLTIPHILLSIYYQFKKYFLLGTFLVVQWLGLCTLTAEGPGSIPGQGTKILQAAQCDKKQNNNKQENNFSPFLFSCFSSTSLFLCWGICQLYSG